MSEKLMKLREVISSFDLPKGIKWYTVGSFRVFEIRGEDGSVRPAWIAYLVTKVGKNWYKYGIEFSEKQSLSTYKQKIEKALIIFQKQVKDEEAKKFNPDGGNLGRAGKK